MKRLFLILLFFMIAGNANFCFSQSINPSKSETESWILEKLSKYGGDHKFTHFSEYSNTFISINYYNIKYYFDKYYFVIEYEMGSSSDNRSTGPSEKFRVSIPIYDINNIKISYSNKLQFFTNKERIRKYDFNKNKTTIEYYFYTYMEKGRETEFEERIKKAFFHLKKFYSSPPNNEAF